MKKALPLVLLVLFALLASGCSRVVLSDNYTLYSGDTIRGDLLVASGNITLQEGSRVTGSVMMLSGNLVANGEIGGGVLLMSGNVMLGPQAVVGGDVGMVSGQVDRAAGSRIEGNPAYLLRIALNLVGIALLCASPLILLLLLILLIVRITRRPLPAGAK